MKKNFYRILGMLCILSLLSACTGNSLYHHVYVAPDPDNEDLLAAIQFLENGKAIIAIFNERRLSDDKKTYIWQGQKIDTLSYRLMDDEITFYVEGREGKKARIDPSYKEFEFSAFHPSSKRTVTYHYQADARLAVPTFKGKYTGKAYVCRSIDDDGMQLDFFCDGWLFRHPASGYADYYSDVQLCPYEQTDDGCLLVTMDKETIELEIKGKNLVFHGFEDNTFRPDKKAFTFWEAVEGMLELAEMKREHEREQWERIRNHR